jgi:MFS family permease
MSQKKTFALRIAAWLTASLFYLYSQAVITAIQSASTEIQQGLQISNALFASIVSTNLIAYSVMQIPVGILLDHYSLKRLSTLSIALFSLCCLALGITDSYWIVLLARLIMGVTAAFSVLGAFKLSSEWFDSQYFATLAGLTVSLGMIGATLGNSQMQHFIETINYKAWFIYAAIFGFALTTSSLLFICNKFEPSGELKSVHHITDDIKSVLLNKNSMILIIYAMLMFTPFLIFKDTFGKVFMQIHYGLDQQNASALVNQLFYASLIAAPLLGIISDKMGRRLPLLWICTAATLTLLILLLTKLTTADLTVFSFGFTSWGFLIAYTVFKETHSPKIVSTGMGVMNSVNMLGGVILSPVIGVLLDLIPNYAPNMPISEVYTYVFICLPFMALIALPLLWGVPETYCRQLVK